MSYIEKKTTKRQTSIITLSDHNKQEIRNIQLQREIMEEDFNDKEQGKQVTKSIFFTNNAKLATKSIVFTNNGKLAICFIKIYIMCMNKNIYFTHLQSLQATSTSRTPKIYWKPFIKFSTSCCYGVYFLKQTINGKISMISISGLVTERLGSFLNYWKKIGEMSTTKFFCQIPELPSGRTGPVQNCLVSVWV